MIANNSLKIAFMLESWLRLTWERCGGDTDDEIWKELYNKVFSNKVSVRIKNMFPDFSYYDPDTSYYEDVSAYINAFIDYTKENDR